MITFTSDFGQNLDAGMMEAAVCEINPQAKVVHLSHDIPSFDLISAAATFETVTTLRSGCHVCVVDPGVGTKRRGLIIETKRGDFLIGPDNGILIPAAKFLKIQRIVALENDWYMRKPTSNTFHGRDVFAPVAAYLSIGMSWQKFGSEITDPVDPPYVDAVPNNGNVCARIIRITKFGSVVLNIWKDDLSGDQFRIKNVQIPFKKTFGDVEKGQPVIFAGDYGRIEIALNLGNFSRKSGLSVGDEIILHKI